MRTEVKEVQIEVEVPNSSGRFNAVLRDGEIGSISNLRERGDLYSISIEKVNAYLEFLEEVAQAMGEK